jgi:hypothetical protein
VSTVKANNVQVGQSGTATNNFTLYQPSTPDGTVRLAVGNSGATTGDVLSVSNTGLSVTGTLSATGNVSFDGGTFVFNESGADKDFRIEGDTDANLFFTDASTDRVGIGTSSLTDKLTAQGTIRTTDGTNYAQFANNFLRSYASGTFYFDNATVGQSFVYRTSSASALDTTALTLTASGNLGLGVTPSAWSIRALQVGSGFAAWSSGVTNSRIFANTYYDGAYKYVGTGRATQYEQDGYHAWFTAPSGTAGATTSITSGQVYTVTTLGSTLGQWQAYFSGLSSIPSIGQSITATATGTLAGGATVTQTITFTQAMTLNADGYLLVGYTTSNGAYKLQVNSQIYATSSTIATSDGRYKENVTSLTGALDIVKALNPVQFTWKQHPVHNFDRSCPTIGFIAQEVQQVLADKPYLNSIIKKNECEIEPAQYETVVLNPAVDEVKDDEGNIIVEAKQAVTEQRLLKEAVKEDFYGIAEGNMIAILTKALQESTVRIEQLEAKVAALEAQ